MPEIVNCPQCARQLRVPDDLLGKKVKCPSCEKIFTAAAKAPTAKPPVPAVEEERFEEDARLERRRRRPVPEDDYDDEPVDEEEHEERPRRRRRFEDEEEELPEEELDRPRRGLRGLNGEYSIDLGQWFEIAKENYGAVLGPMIGYMFVALIIDIALAVIPFVGPFISLFVDPPLQAGYTIVALAQLKGKRWSFGDFFSGFQWYGTLLANFWLTLLIVLGCMVPTVAVFILAAISRSDALLFVAFGVALVNLVILLFVTIRTTLFNVQIIVDRKCGPIEAIQGNWALTQGHTLGLLGVSILVGLIAFAGVLLCGIGALFTVPFAIMIMNSGYLLIGGSRPPRRTAARRRRLREEEYDE
jgi:predicted Zn finger-like uncharacterized protein